MGGQGAASPNPVRVDQAGTGNGPKVPNTLQAFEGSAGTPSDYPNYMPQSVAQAS